MNSGVCPFCGKKHKIELDFNAQIFDCSSERRYFVQNSVFKVNNNKELNQRLNAIYNYIEEKPYYYNKVKHYWDFYYDEEEKNFEDSTKINVFNMMKDYPFDVADRVAKIMLNLATEYPSLANTFKMQNFFNAKKRLLYCDSDDIVMEVSSIFSALCSWKYIELASMSNNDPNTKEYRITIKGWEKISELKKKKNESMQGFIAMSFDESVQNIEQAFKKAISNAGFFPQIIKDKEHNNYIMPEIFYEIKKSKFLVVDITKSNNGAYYEAGYAQGLGKEVIVCCRKDVFDGKSKDFEKPHFDIAQKSMILWKDESELIERLTRRIKATIG